MSQMMMVALKTRHLRGCGSKPVHGLIAVVSALSKASLFKKAIGTFINHHYLKKLVPEASTLAFNIFDGVAVKNTRRFNFISCSPIFCSKPKYALAYFYRWVRNLKLKQQ